MTDITRFVAIEDPEPQEQYTREFMMTLTGGDTISPRPLNRHTSEFRNMHMFIYNPKEVLYDN